MVDVRHFRMCNVRRHLINAKCLRLRVLCRDSHDQTGKSESEAAVTRLPKGRRASFGSAGRCCGPTQYIWPVRELTVCLLLEKGAADLPSGGRDSKGAETP